MVFEGGNALIKRGKFEKKGLDIKSQFADKDVPFRDEVMEAERALYEIPHSMIEAGYVQKMDVQELQSARQAARDAYQKIDRRLVESFGHLTSRIDDRNPGAKEVEQVFRTAHNELAHRLVHIDEQLLDRLQQK